MSDTTAPDSLGCFRQLYSMASLMPVSFATFANVREYGGSNFSILLFCFPRIKRDMTYSATTPNRLNINSDTYPARGVSALHPKHYLVLIASFKTLAILSAVRLRLS